MSHPVTESDNYDTAVVVPDNLDTTYIGVVPQGMGSLANRTKFLNTRLTDGVTGSQVIDPAASGASLDSFYDPSPKLGPLNPFTQIGTRVVETVNWMRDRIPGLYRGSGLIVSSPFSPMADGIVWGYTEYHSPGILALLQKVASSSYVHLPLPQLPYAGTLTSVRIRCAGGQATSTLPANYPSISLYRIHGDGSGNYVAAQVGSTTTDSVASGYGTATEHYLTIGGLSENLQTRALPSVAGNVLYQLKLTGEFGSPSTANNFVVIGLECLVTGALNGAG